MATTEIVLLSSSPVRSHFFDAHAAICSSPALPPQSKSIRKIPQLRTGSRAAPIPDNASGFMSAAGLLLRESENTKDPDTIREVNAPGNSEELKSEEETVTLPKPKAVRKTRAKKDNTEGLENSVKEKKPRKPRTTKALPDVNDDAAPPEKPTRKPRAKKAVVENQSKISKGKVTKTSTTKDNKNPNPKPKSTKKSITVGQLPADEHDPFAAPLGRLQLDPAIKRRTDWTPPKASEKRALAAASGQGLENGQDSPNIEETSLVSKGFTELLGTFGCGKGEIEIAPKTNAEPIGLRKRKLIELVKTNVGIREEEPAVKVKTVKKKPRTITELATAAYLLDAEEDTDKTTPSPAPLLQYLTAKGTSSETGSVGASKASKFRAQSPVKRPGRTVKGKKAVVVPPPLLSPEEAMKQLAKQDYVFGTSSQLAREDSPTLLRDLQQAMMESNQMNDPFVDFDSQPTMTPPGLKYGRRSTSYIGKRRLWSASSRGLEGDMMNVDVVDLSHSPEVRTGNETAVLPGYQTRKPQDGNELCSIGDRTPIPETEIWHDIDDEKTPITKDSDSNKVTRALGPIEAAIRTELLSSPMRSERAIGATATKVREPSKKASKSGVGAKMPIYSEYTTARLSKEISAYGFKPIKTRNHMISLLEKCWESKQQAALGNLGSNHMLRTSPTRAQVPSRVSSPSRAVTTASPKRGRGRPRKDAQPLLSAEFSEPPPSAQPIPIDSDSDIPLCQVKTPRKAVKKRLKGNAKTENVLDDISESDSPLTPSPRRRAASSEPSRLNSLELSQPETTAPLSPGSALAEQHRHITQAIKSAPCATNSHEPSWHEKILLYDPIVLEDLTVWLNTGALERVGWDGEVQPKDVKSWCERESVCCLWRENLRGGSRSRY
jgi:hypothetical protein